MDHHKALKKLTFVSNPVPFNGQHYEKQKGPGSRATSHSSHHKTSSEKFLNWQYIYYLIKFDVI